MAWPAPTSTRRHCSPIVQRHHVALRWRMRFPGLAAGSYVRHAAGMQNLGWPDRYCFIGRWFPQIADSHVTMTTINQGTEVRCTVMGTAAVAALYRIGAETSNPPAIACRIDGGPYRRLTLPAVDGGGMVTVSVATGLDPGQHTLALITSGLQETDPLWSGTGLHFSGLVLDPGGTIGSWACGHPQILFLGDSITAGINALGRGSVPAVNAGEVAFPHVASRLLGADSNPVGFGAVGITKGGNGGVPAAAETLPFAMKDRPVTDAPVPVAVVINLGTNDRRAESSAFRAGYRAYVQRVQGMVPGVPVFCCQPFIGCFADEIRATVSATPGTHYVDTAGWPLTTTDGVHPDRDGHQTAGTLLAGAIRRVLGECWSAGV